MRNLAIRFFNDVPVVILTVIESIIIFAATMVAKLAFTQIAPLPAAWWRVGFALLLLWVWRKPWKKFTEVLPTHARGWLWLAALGISSVFMNTTFYMAIGTLNVGVAVAIEFIGPLAVAVMTGRHWRGMRDRYAQLELFCLAEQDIPGRAGGNPDQRGSVGDLHYLRPAHCTRRAPSGQYDNSAYYRFRSTIGIPYAPRHQWRYPSPALGNVAAPAVGTACADSTHVLCGIMRVVPAIYF